MRVQPSFGFPLKRVSSGLYTDSSPQEKGIELYCSTWDQVVYTEDTSQVMCRRRQLPPLRIGGYLLNRTGKLYALLHQLWCIAGPSVECLRALCNEVRSITTDFGTEKALANAPCLLRQIAETHNLQLPSDFRDDVFQFPKAVHSPGWCHIWDTLLRRACTSLTFFPEFLAQAKSISAFVRQYRVDIERDLKAADERASAAILKNAKAPAFASWRWTTLFETVRCVQEVHMVLKLKWHLLTCTSKMKDRVTVQSVESALKSARFEHILEFMHWLCSLLLKLQRWGTSCACHQDPRAMKLSNNSNNMYFSPAACFKVQTLQDFALNGRSLLSCCLGLQVFQGVTRHLAWV